MNNPDKTPPPWLDDDGRFLRGKHRGSLAEDVVQRDAPYFRWALNTCNLPDDDREVFLTLLRFRGRLASGARGA